jgi:hypothetical protein
MREEGKEQWFEKDFSQRRGGAEDAGGEGAIVPEDITQRRGGAEDAGGRGEPLTSVSVGGLCRKTAHGDIISQSRGISQLGE